MWLKKDKKTAYEGQTSVKNDLHAQTHTSSFFVILDKVTTLIAPGNPRNLSIHKQALVSSIIKESRYIDFPVSFHLSEATGAHGIRQ